MTTKLALRVLGFGWWIKVTNAWQTFCWFLLPALILLSCSFLDLWHFFCGYFLNLCRSVAHYLHTWWMLTEILTIVFCFVTPVSLAFPFTCFVLVVSIPMSVHKQFHKLSWRQTSCFSSKNSVKTVLVKFCNGFSCTFLYRA